MLGLMGLVGVLAWQLEKLVADLVGLRAGMVGKREEVQSRL